MNITFAPRGILQIDDARIIFKNFEIRDSRTLSDSALRFRRTAAALVRFRGSSFPAHCAAEVKGSGLGIKENRYARESPLEQLK